jgi:hypothetical protein
VVLVKRCQSRTLNYVFSTVGLTVPFPQTGPVRRSSLRLTNATSRQRAAIPAGSSGALVFYIENNLNGRSKEAGSKNSASFVFYRKRHKGSFLIPAKDWE